MPTVSSDNKLLRVYINGALASETKVSSPVKNSNILLTVGNCAWHARAFNGLIKEVKIVNSVAIEDILPLSEL